MASITLHALIKALKPIILLKLLLPYIIFNNNKTKILLFWICFQILSNKFKLSKVVSNLVGICFQTSFSIPHLNSK
jgi:hypothetical protein